MQSLKQGQQNIEQFRPGATKPNNLTKSFAPLQPSLPDPDAMDTLARLHTQERLTLADDEPPPGYQQDQKPPFPPHDGYY